MVHHGSIRSEGSPRGLLVGEVGWRGDHGSIQAPSPASTGATSPNSHAHQRQRGSRRSALDLEGQPRLFAMPGMFVACRASSPRSTSLSWLFGAMALAADAAVAQEDEAPEGSFVPCGVRGGVQAVTTVNEPSRRSTVLAS